MFTIMLKKTLPPDHHLCASFCRRRVKAEKGRIHSGFPSPLSLGCFAEHKTAVTFHISDEQISINSRWEEKGDEEEGEGEKKYIPSST